MQQKQGSNSLLTFILNSSLNSEFLLKVLMKIFFFISKSAASLVYQIFFNCDVKVLIKLTVFSSTTVDLFSII